MKTKTVAPREDPETAARRAVEEARAEADKTSATQKLLSRRSRRVLRVFGLSSGGGSRGFSGAAGGGGAGSGASGVPAFDSGSFNPSIDPDSEGGFGDRNRFFY
jgi:hypothetical protein